MQSELQIAQREWAYNRRDIKCMKAKTVALCNSVCIPVPKRVMNAFEFFHIANDYNARKKGVKVKPC